MHGSTIEVAKKRTSYLDNVVRASAGHQVVSGRNVSVDEILPLQIVASLGHTQRCLDLLSASTELDPGLDGMCVCICH